MKGKFETLGGGTRDVEAKGSNSLDVLIFRLEFVVEICRHGDGAYSTLIDPEQENDRECSTQQRQSEASGEKCVQPRGIAAVLPGRQGADTSHDRARG